MTGLTPTIYKLTEDFVRKKLTTYIGMVIVVADGSTLGGRTKMAEEEA